MEVGVNTPVKKTQTTQTGEVHKKRTLWGWLKRLSITPITPGAKRAVITLFIFTIFLFVMNLLFTARLVHHAQSVSRAQCHFYSDLAGLPITISPSTKKASLLGVEIIADSRRSWIGLKCQGQLPQPSRSFIRWARYYHVPAS